MKIVKLLALLPVIGLAACSNSTMGSLSFALTSSNAAAPHPAAAFSASVVGSSVVAAGDSTVIAVGSDTVIVRSAELVLRQVELKRADVPTCDAVSENGDCEEFETAATLVSLPLGSTAMASQVAVSAPPGLFDKLEFQIHKPGSSDDAAFATISIRVTGTYSQAGSRSDFTFVSDVDQSQESTLVPAVSVQEGGTLNVTLRVDISTWFLNGAKTALVSPATANKGQPNESVVANNIQNSFKAFEDDNHDGLEDH